MAYQLVHMDGVGLDVAMGGGRREFFGSGLGGKRRDPEDDLVKQWLAGRPGRSYVTTADQLTSLKPGEQVLGLFANSHMTYIAERGKDSSEPSLSQMTVAAIDLLAACEGRRILVLGAMRELGERSAALHAEVGSYAAQAGIDELWGVGPELEAAVAAFGDNGRWFADCETAIGELPGRFDSNDTVLVKGSRGARMERVLQALLAGER